MAYVSVPKDLSKIKTKVLFNLTQRQLICFSAGALIGVPLFFILRNRIGVSSAAMVMMLAMIPAFLLAMYEKNGQPLEKVAADVERDHFMFAQEALEYGIIDEIYQPRPKGRRG